MGAADSLLDRWLNVEPGLGRGDIGPLRRTFVEQVTLGLLKIVNRQHMLGCFYLKHLRLLLPIWILIMPSTASRSLEAFGGRKPRAVSLY